MNCSFKYAIGLIYHNTNFFKNSVIDFANQYVNMRCKIYLTCADYNAKISVELKNGSLDEILAEISPLKSGKFKPYDPLLRESSSLKANKPSNYDFNYNKGELDLLHYNASPPKELLNLQVYTQRSADHVPSNEALNDLPSIPDNRANVHHVPDNTPIVNNFLSAEALCGVPSIPYSRPIVNNFLSLINHFHFSFPQIYNKIFPFPADTLGFKYLGYYLHVPKNNTFMHNWDDKEKCRVLIAITYNLYEYYVLRYRIVPGLNSGNYFSLSYLEKKQMFLNKVPSMYYKSKDLFGCDPDFHVEQLPVRLLKPFINKWRYISFTPSDDTLYYKIYNELIYYIICD